MSQWTRLLWSHFAYAWTKSTTKRALLPSQDDTILAIASASLPMGNRIYWCSIFVACNWIVFRTLRRTGQPRGSF